MKNHQKNNSLLRCNTKMKLQSSWITTQQTSFLKLKVRMMTQAHLVLKTTLAIAMERLISFRILALPSNPANH